jgi:hypothetical protein
MVGFFGQQDEFLLGGVERAEYVSSGLVWIER